MKNSTIDGLHVVISGRVQGVGFRYAAHNAATRLGLNGWVRNLPDGRVEAFFEGDKPVLEQMLDWCRQGPRMAHVTDVSQTWRRETPQYNRFRITA